jgi:hypothetical protein
VIALPEYIIELPLRAVVPNQGHLDDDGTSPMPDAFDYMLAQEDQRGRYEAEVKRDGLDLVLAWGRWRWCRCWPALVLACGVVGRG